MKKLFLFFLFVVAAANVANGQKNVGINTQNPDPSAALDINSTDKGVLIPRMSKGQRDLIPSPATGLLIYQNDGDVGFYFFNGSNWVSLSGNGSNGATLPPLEGNAGKVLTNNGTETIWGDQIGALSLFDANGNKLGRIISYGIQSYQVVTSTGYTVTIGVNGQLIVPQLFWSQTGCTGTPYINASGQTFRNAKFLVYSAYASKLYRTSDVSANVASPIAITYASTENTSGTCPTNTAANPSGQGYALTEITLPDAGIGFPYPFTLPLETR